MSGTAFFPPDRYRRSGFPLSLKLATTLSLLVMSHAVAPAQADFETKASGTWNSASTWRIISGSSTNGFPGATDNAFIRNGHTVTPGGQSQDCAHLTIDPGGTLSIDSTTNIRINEDPGSATINGNLIISSSGTLSEAGPGTRTLLIGDGGKLTLSGAAAFPSFDVYSLASNSTVEYSAATNQNVQSGIAYGNLTLAGNGTKTVAPIPPDTVFTSNGKITIASGVTFDVSTNILYARFNGDVEINGTLDASVGIVVVEMHGPTWTNNGTYLRSVTPGFGWQPTTTFRNTQIGGSTPVEKLFDVCFEGNSRLLTSIDSARTIEIEAGATLTGQSSATYRLTGNWINNGAFNSNGSTVSFIGTVSQTVGASTFDTLIVNNPAGVTLAGDVNISTGGTLTLTNGNVTSGAYTLTISNSSPSALALGAHRVLGSITRAIAGGSAGMYAFLNSNARITPNGVGNPSSISMREFPNMNPPGLGLAADTNKIVKRYYSVSQTGAGSGFTFTMRLPYLQAEARGNEALYALFRDDGAGWANMGSIAVDTSNNYVEQSALSGFSTWAIAESDQTLPIQLVHFGAGIIPNTGNVLLRWGTMTETNNYGFFVQRGDGSQGSYADLPNSFVPGHGTTLEPQEYDWTDIGVNTGIHYYRLRQVDLDGSSHFTDGVRVEVSAPTDVSETAARVFRLEQNFPNPFNPSTTIEFSVGRSSYTTLVVYNLLGQKVATLFADVATAGERYHARFDGSGIANGIYLAKLVSGASEALRTMILLK